MLRLMPSKYTVRHVPSGQNIADCLSRLIKIPALSHCNSTPEKYVRMVAISATPRAMTSNEITAVGRLVIRGMRIVVPLSLSERVLELVDEGHQGIVKTKDRLRSSVVTNDECYG